MDDGLRHFLAGLVAPVFWATIAALGLWFLRRFLPGAEKYVRGPEHTYNFWFLIGRTIARLRRAIRRRAS